MDTSDSTTWPSKVTLAGRFTDTAGTNNASFGETKLDGREFTVSSVAADSDGHKYLLLSTTDTDTVNITDTDIQVLHTASTDVEAYKLLDTTGDIDFSTFGGLQNNSGSGKTGDIMITTVGHSNTDTYNIILDMTKQS